MRAGWSPALLLLHQDRGRTIEGTWIDGVWSRWRESNPRCRSGKPTCHHNTSSAKAPVSGSERDRSALRKERCSESSPLARSARRNRCRELGGSRTRVLRSKNPLQRHHLLPARVSASARTRCPAAAAVLTGIEPAYPRRQRGNVTRRFQVQDSEPSRSRAVLALRSFTQRSPQRGGRSGGLDGNRTRLHLIDSERTSPDVSKANGRHESGSWGALCRRAPKGWGAQESNLEGRSGQRFYKPLRLHSGLAPRT